MESAHHVHVQCIHRDLPPCLQQGVGFGTYIHKYRGWAKLGLPSILLNWHAMQFYSDMAGLSNQG